MLRLCIFITQSLKKMPLMIAPVLTSCDEENEPLGNRLYRYELVDNKLVNPTLLLDSPASPGAAHNGGAILIGPDNNIYLPIGEVSYMRGQISNNDDGDPPDGRGGILRITQNGEMVEPTILGDEDPLNSTMPMEYEIVLELILIL